MDKVWTFQDGDHGSISTVSFLLVRFVDFKSQKPILAWEYLLNKLSLRCIFLFRVLKLNKSLYVNTILKVELFLTGETYHEM